MKSFYFSFYVTAALLLLGLYRPAADYLADLKNCEDKKATVQVAVKPGDYQQNMQLSNMAPNVTEISNIVMKEVGGSGKKLEAWKFKGGPGLKNRKSNLVKNYPLRTTCGR